MATPPITINNRSYDLATQIPTFTADQKTLLANLQPEPPIPPIDTLKGRVEEFSTLKTRFEQASFKDKAIACFLGGLTVNLVVGAILGFIFMPPIGGAIIGAYLIFSLLAFSHAETLNKDDGRPIERPLSFKLILLALFGGQFRLIRDLLTRKDFLQQRLEPLEAQVSEEIETAGTYFRDNHEALQKALEEEIDRTNQLHNPALKTSLEDLRKLKDEIQKGLAMANVEAIQP